jgi:hypothetical protein
MFLISHRGNLYGPDRSFENTPTQISKTLEMGYHCEIDVWKNSDGFFLGHDDPKYEIKKEFLKNEKLWCHAKNLSALESMLYHGVHCFWHETDKFTITSKGYIWTFPEEEVTKNSVIVHKGSSWKEKNYDCAAVCTDFIL